MNAPPAEHPIWSTLRLGIVAVVLSLMLVFGYNTFDWRKDGTTLITVLCGLGGFDVLYRNLTKGNSNASS